MTRGGEDTIEVRTLIERKQPDLPRYAVVPARALRAWALAGTTAVEVSINGMPVERRTVKPWDSHRWFVSITARDCSRLAIDTGSRITLRLRPAGTELPDELAGLIRASQAAARAWNGLTPAQQRMLREHVLAARQAATRTRRARQGLLGPDGNNG